MPKFSPPPQSPSPFAGTNHPENGEGEAGVQVIGVSPDKVAKHLKFAMKHGFAFPLLADPEKALIQACGLWVEKSFLGKKFMGVARTTFFVGPDGNVRHVWQKVKPDGHAEEVLAEVRPGTPSP